MDDRFAGMTASPDTEDLRLGWRIAPETGRDAGVDHDFWLDRGPENTAVTGEGLNRSRERADVRSSAGIDLRAGRDDGIETGFDMAWER